MSPNSRWNIRLLLVVLGIMTSHGPSTSHAGPWTKSLGELYVKVGEGFFFSDSYRDASGELQSGTDYLGATTSVYFEVGVWKGLHLWGYLPYMVASNSFDDGSSWIRSSGGDALLGVQYTPPLPFPFPAALKLEVKVPFYDVGGVEGSYARNFPAPGDGQVDLTFWISAGGSLSTIPLFFFGEVGFRKRTEAFVGQPADPRPEFFDGIAFFASVGYTLFDRLILAINSGGILPFDAGDYTKGYITLGPALYLPIYKGLAAEASFDPMIYTNANASPGIGFSLGMSYKR